MIENDDSLPRYLRQELARMGAPLTPNVQNSDNEWLEPVAGMIGHVSEVNGKGAQEVQGFAPTRHELKQLYLYWAKRKVDLDLLMFRYDTVGSDWLRISSLAGRRLGRIERLLGAEACAPLRGVVEAEFESSGELWRAFKEGDYALRDSLLDAFYRQKDSHTDVGGTGE
jgi:hypothetical protein